MSTKAIAERVRGFGMRAVVITGGEPLLQSSEVVGLVEELREHQITIETNGTFSPPESLIERVQWSVSPKLQSSGHQLDTGVLQKYVEIFRESNIRPSQLKFVISSKDDWEQFWSLYPSIFPNVNDPYELVIQPVAASHRTTERYLTAVQDLTERLLKEYPGSGVRVLPQLHRLIWGNQRGK